MAKKPAKSNKKVSRYEPNVNKYEHTMKMVTSETCIACKTQCALGISYMERMSKPGAIGKGVQCHLTKGKGMK